MTKNRPVSDTEVELSLCSYKTERTQRRSICKNNNLLCKEIRLCINCSNEKIHKEKIDSSLDVDEKNDYYRFATRFPNTLRHHIFKIILKIWN